MAHLREYSWSGRAAANRLATQFLVVALLVEGSPQSMIEKGHLLSRRTHPPVLWLMAVNRFDLSALSNHLYSS